MSVEIITKQDLNEFGDKLIGEIKKMLGAAEPIQDEWLKSDQVRKMLKISRGTLQNLRVRGTLNFTRIGGIFYYKHGDIIKLMEGRTPAKRTFK